ncbi:unnamed protein product, partial [marine sediment metagenome]
WGLMPRIFNEILKVVAQKRHIILIIRGSSPLSKIQTPCPAIALDRCWNVVATNRAALALLSAHVSPELLAPPVNVFRLSLHPQGLAPRIANLAQWRAHLFERLRQQIQATADPALIALQAELLQYPAPPESDALVLAGEMLGVVMPFCFESVHGMLSLISTTTIFGTPVDVTLQELAVESFFPADDFTAQVLRKIAQENPGVAEG